MAPQALAISLSGDDDGTLRGYREALLASGTVVEPLKEVPWGDAFGMCVDRSGITWMVNLAGSQARDSSVLPDPPHRRHTITAERRPCPPQARHRRRRADPLPR